MDTTKAPPGLRTPDGQAAWRRLYPFDSHFLPVGGGQTVHYVDEGPRDGQPVVMVHGNPTWSFYYRDVVAALAQTHRCVVPDHVGCGFSSRPADGDYDFTLAQRVDDLTVLLDQLQRDHGLRAPVDLVVHDWGGMIGMAWAARHPALVRRVVVLNTAAFPNPRGERIPVALRLVRDTPVGAWLVERFNAFALGAVTVGTKTRKLTAAEKAGYLAPYDTPENRLATARFVQDIPLGPGDPGFDVVTETAAKLDGLRDKPARIFWGLRDFVFDGAFLADWQRRWPEAEVTRFDDAGHFVLEDKRDVVIPGIRDFLSAEGTRAAALAASDGIR